MDNISLLPGGMIVRDPSLRELLEHMAIGLRVRVHLAG